MSEQALFGLKRCPKCEKFYTSNHIGKAGYCRKCKREYNKAYFASNKDRHAERVRNVRRNNPNIIRNQTLRKFGLTQDDYDRILASQDGVCAVHGDTCDNGRTLVIDHDHTTGTFRGILCGKCNTGLGAFADSVDRLEQAQRYLLQSRNILAELAKRK